MNTEKSKAPRPLKDGEYRVVGYEKGGMWYEHEDLTARTRETMGNMWRGQIKIIIRNQNTRVDAVKLQDGTVYRSGQWIPPSSPEAAAISSKERDEDEEKISWHRAEIARLCAK